MNTTRRHIRFPALLLSVCLLFTTLPVVGFTAQAASGTVAYIGDAGYDSLGAAVSAASAGDTITLAENDDTAQTVTINQTLTIELDGHSLTNTSFLIAGGNVVIRDRQGVATISCEYEQVIHSGYSRVYGTVVSTGGSLTLEGVNVNGYIGREEHNDSGVLSKAVAINGGTVTINSGSFTGGDSFFNAGGDAVYFHTGNLTINGGTFSGYPNAGGNGCGLSSTNKPGNSLTIRHGTFIGGYNSAAFWLGGNINNLDSLTDYFLGEENYVVGDFDPNNVTIGANLFLSPVFTEPENGSADENDPIIIELAAGDSVTLDPHVLGGAGGELTYAWYKDGAPLENAGGSACTVNGEGDFPGDYHVVVSETGTDRTHSITVYWRVVERKTVHSHNICGQTGCAHDGHTALDYTALGGQASGQTLAGGNYYLTEDITNVGTSILITGAVNLCLNGRPHDLRRRGERHLPRRRGWLAHRLRLSGEGSDYGKRGA